MKKILRSKIRNWARFHEWDSHTILDLVDDIDNLYRGDENKLDIVRSDDWEAAYLNGKCIAQAHSLGEGMGMIRFLEKVQKDYEIVLGIDDVFVFYAEDEDQSLASESGAFPENFSDLKGDYQDL